MAAVPGCNGLTYLIASSSVYYFLLNFNIRPRKNVAPFWWRASWRVNRIENALFFLAQHQCYDYQQPPYNKFWIFYVPRRSIISVNTAGSVLIHFLVRNIYIEGVFGWDMKLFRLYLLELSSWRVFFKGERRSSTIFWIEAA